MAGVASFYMYKSDRFMEYAPKHLDVTTSSESVQQVRSVLQLAPLLPTATGGERGYAAEGAVKRWLQGIYTQISIEALPGFPDFLALHDDGAWGGYEVKYTSSPRGYPDRLHAAAVRGSEMVRLGRLGYFCLVVVTDTQSNANVANHLLRFSPRFTIPEEVTLITGHLTGVSTTEGAVAIEFMPFSVDQWPYPPE